MAKRKKNRRIKKPKYLSLRLQFPGEKVLVVDNSKSIDPHIVNPVPTSTSTVDHHHHQVEDDDDMEYLLSTSDGGATSTLTGLLLDSSDAFPAPVPVCSSDVDRAAADQLSPSASVSYVSDLVRTALRSRERESSNIEERYVRYSEVVNDDQIRRDHEEVTSDYYCNIMKNDYNQYRNQASASASATRLKRLSLKLDYDEIINAWSDKGGFYVQHSDLPQTVPDINHHIFSPPISNVGGGGLWSVPEVNGWWGEPMLKIEEEEVVVGVPQDEDHHHHRPKADEEWKWKAAAGQHREASVLRYKEKKRNRLFSKTIRYQVRKENAQKRPRVKGRFVKRS